jgi:hypothetical protein
VSFKEPTFYSGPEVRSKQKSRTPEKTQHFRLHVVSHTHWDREWTSSFERQRSQLVRLIDRLLELMERNYEFRYFVLDGQTIVLEDYLEIRPENRERLKRLIEVGRLEIGPWYVQPDEFSVSGESLIRNLQIGRRIGEDFGGMMKAGYLPDAFGHVAQMPQLLRGFDIDSFIFTRGLGDEQERLGTEFLWIAPDGSRVLAVNQRNGYDNGMHLGFEKSGEYNRDASRLDMAVDRIREQMAQLGDHARAGGDGVRHLLINNGGDYEDPQASLPKILQYLNPTLGDATIEHTTFSRFVSNLRRAGLSLPDFSGELRGSKRHFILSGILSTRVPVKQQNHACETLLEKYAEPLATMAAHLTDIQNQAGFLQHAWKTLQQNHPHDSIGGCSVDEVQLDMLPRFDRVRRIGEVTIAGATTAIASRVRRKAAPSFVVFNPLPVSRNEVVAALVLLPPDHPGRDFNIIDGNGRLLPTHVRHVHKIRASSNYSLPSSFLRLSQDSFSFDERLACFMHDYKTHGLAPDKKDKPWRVVELEGLLENLPACGYRTYSLNVAETPAAIRPGGVKVSGNTIENAFLRMRVYPDGTFDLHHKATKRDFRRCNLLEDVEDTGDAYDYSPAKRSAIFTSKNRRGRLRFIQKSSLRATVECSFVMMLPEGFDRKAGKRSRRLVKCLTRVLLTVNASDPWVSVVCEFENQAKDHRLSASIGAPVNAKASVSGQPFYVVERALKVFTKRNWKQPPSTTSPLQNFCALEDRRGGVAVLVRGLYEYRALREGRNTALKLTLLRAVGWLSRNDLSARSGHAGPPLATPQAQCLGRQRFEYAIMPYAASRRAANVAQQAQRFQAPVIDALCANGSGGLPGEFSFVRVEPATLQFSALKKCLHRDTVILRVVNLSPQRIRAKVRCGKPLRHAWKVTLAENRIEEVPVQHDDTVEVDLPGWRIATLELEPGRMMHGV